MKTIRCVVGAVALVFSPVWAVLAAAQSPAAQTPAPQAPSAPPASATALPETPVEPCPPPAKQPPANSPVLLRCMQLVAHPVNETVVDQETYSYYIRTPRPDSAAD